ncbi:MAG: sulfur carrier protein ThiS [Rudaea sp.]|nr:sulfur carrier protein ThiS [Rudaea sp.]
MTKIELNGEQRELVEPISVAALLEISGYAGRAVAVEINREIVSKSMHAQHLVRDGDRIEVVQAIGGG